MKKTLVIFAGSKEISDSDKVKLNTELMSFFEWVKNDIKKIIYWWWDIWVMWIVYNAALVSWIEIKWMSLEKYREYDELKDIEMNFYQNNDERIRAFYEKWDIFLALPGGLWTIREILTINELIKRNNDFKKIFVSLFFKSFYNLIDELERENMIAN